VKPAKAKRPGNPEGRSSLPRVKRLAALLTFILALPGLAAAEAPAECPQHVGNKRLVIIIDDMGYNLSRGRDALALPGNITYAVIPYTPFSRQLAEQADTAGKEVMLHAPMSTLQDTPLERGGLTAEQPKQEFRDTLAAAIEQIPEARGINNHMGSDLTQRRPQMAWLMQELRGRDMYFVDSRTSEKTVAATVAAEFSVPHLSRQVFLDNERTAEAIDERFKVLLSRLDEAPVAVGIGHPYPETIAYLQEALPQLAAQGIDLVFVSEALAEQRPLEIAAADCDYNLTSTPRSAI
jgi:polysaccharide deacetylase 2 family uncharacterized protein YibQ